MQRNAWVAVVTLCLAAPIFAEEVKPGTMPDMKKMGPESRWPKNEKKTKGELSTFYKEWTALWEKGDLNGVADMVDFPVIMMTDDSKGKFGMMQATREQWTAMMAPFVEMMKTVKDLKLTHKETCQVFSDD